MNSLFYFSLLVLVAWDRRYDLHSIGEGCRRLGQASSGDDDDDDEPYRNLASNRVITVVAIP